MTKNRNQNKPPRSYKVAGMFAGIGGIELGFHRADHQTVIFSEIDPSAKAVLDARFKGIPNHPDVTTLKALPREVDLIAGGFPCQDLSQAGQATGINGARSSLVSHVFRLIRQRPVEIVVLENVPFMLQLNRGQAMRHVVSELEELGYMWAYRVVDSRAFGLLQRRRRVYLIASQSVDPRRVVFADEADTVDELVEDWRSAACGFYWTEGNRGLGFAYDAVPTLKGSSTVGIPSPPAVVLTNGEVVKPTIRAAERLQGFRAGWTKPAENVGRASFRWRLVGNAVSVPAAAWIGRRLASPGKLVNFGERELSSNGRWPTAAYNVDGRRVVVDISEWPKIYSQRMSLDELLDGESEPLSVKATTGFLNRAVKSKLLFPEGFLDILRRHIENGANSSIATVNGSSRKKRLTNGSGNIRSDGQDSPAKHGARTTRQETVPRTRAALQNK